MLVKNYHMCHVCTVDLVVVCSLGFLFLKEVCVVGFGKFRYSLRTGN